MTTMTMMKKKNIGGRRVQPFTRNAASSMIVPFLLVFLRQPPTCTSFLPHHHVYAKHTLIRRQQNGNVRILSSRSEIAPVSSASSSSSSLSFSELALTAPSIDASSIAEGLGYLVGTGSLLLYTPIAVRVVRQGSADGLTISTWWLKLSSYTCAILYSFDQGYPLSTYLETVIIAVESLTILVLVAYYQRSLLEPKFLAFAGLFVTLVLTVALNNEVVPSEVFAFGQTSSAVLNVGALLPQFALNARTRTAGDYSPITASLATVGCTIRLFTTYQLAGSDPLLLGSYGLAFVLNASLLLQILYYGIRVEGNSLMTVLTADVASTTTTID